MTIDRRHMLGLGVAAAAQLAAAPVRARARARAAATTDRIPLWGTGLPDPTPAGLREAMTERSTHPGLRDRALTGVAAPWLEFERAKRPTGAAIIVMPGGGYQRLAWDKEGPDLARWFAARGVAGFSLAYRMPHDGWRGGPDTSLADAQRAVRLVRARAGEFGIDPARIAVMGFSAGGHLCANLGAQFDRAIYPQRDAVDRVSARPDLVAPIYPAIMVDSLSAALPPGIGLFGVPIDEATARRHSPHLNVAVNAPPHFLLHAEDDPLVGAEHSLALRAALKARKIAVETHLFAQGGHGFGLRVAADSPLADWPARLLAFGRTTGWITT